jgi:ferritin-like metal-binding protein YciE
MALARCSQGLKKTHPPVQSPIIGKYIPASTVIHTSLPQEFGRPTSAPLPSWPQVFAVLGLRAVSHPPDRTSAARGRDLKASLPYELGGAAICCLTPAYLRGLAYLQVGDGEQAQHEFQKILDHPGIVENNVIGVLAHLQRGRAQALSGDKAAARNEYLRKCRPHQNAKPAVAQTHQGLQFSARASRPLPKPGTSRSKHDSGQPTFPPIWLSYGRDVQNSIPGDGYAMALKEVLIDELRDMYSAENQLVKALPKLAKGAKNAKLKELFTGHLEETKGQVERLKKVFGHLEEKPTGSHCNGMEGVIEEGADALEKDAEGASFDSGLIGAALRTEHYEIAGYKASIAMAKTLGMSEVVSLLTANLKEEVAAAEKITSAAEPILAESAKEPEMKSGPMSGKEKYSAQKSREDEKKAAPDLKKRAS